MKVLITGGAGYIGSMVCHSLRDHGHDPVIIDSMAVSSSQNITEFPLYVGDIADETLINSIIQDHPDITSVVHCAGKILVPESVIHPDEYYYENVSKSLELFKNLKAVGVKKILFSSSASIYEARNGESVDENSPLDPLSPYAKNKLMTEMILEDFCHAFEMEAISLRYFNPIGADPKMRCGPNINKNSHLLGNLIRVAEGTTNSMNITGFEWPTKDGTGVRDYIHVWDLAEAHVAALVTFDSIFESESNFQKINVGGGSPTTVMEFIDTFEEVYGSKITTVKAPPRDGDTAGAFANIEKAARLMDWRPRMSVEQGIADAIKWHRKRTLE
ncbi:MAG: UDP-glucose 4-epimerase GalE [Dehalococcoidia bacterium]